LLNGSGDTVSISASPGQRGSDGLLSINSPSHSRTSSAQGSYSTSATTFDDVDEPRRGRDEALTMASPTEKKPEVKGGNVIVSVRVRPDGKGKDAKKDGEWTRSEGEWMVDGRKSLIAYRGRELFSKAISSSGHGRLSRHGLCIRYDRYW
jgi:centromeric protein E